MFKKKSRKKDPKHYLKIHRRYYMRRLAMSKQYTRSGYSTINWSLCPDNLYNIYRNMAFTSSHIHLYKRAYIRYFMRKGTHKCISYPSSVYWLPQQIGNDAHPPWSVANIHRGWISGSNNKMVGANICMPVELLPSEYPDWWKNVGSTGF